MRVPHGVNFRFVFSYVTRLYTKFVVYTFILAFCPFRIHVLTYPDILSCLPAFAVCGIQLAWKSFGNLTKSQRQTLIWYFNDFLVCNLRFAVAWESFVVIFLLFCLLFCYTICIRMYVCKYVAGQCSWIVAFNNGEAIESIITAIFVRKTETRQSEREREWYTCAYVHMF